MSRPERSRHGVVNMRYLAANKEKQAQDTERTLQAANQQFGDDEKHRDQAIAQKRQALGQSNLIFF